MGRARSALALALLLSGSVLISVQSKEASSSLESWEIEEEEQSKAATSTDSTQTTARKVPRGFVTPRPFVIDHPLFSSTWAAWSAWSFCVNNVRIRVRACNTVRGFSCVGKNQETEPCANSLYHHHPPPQRPHSDYDVVDPYEDDRIEAIKQLYPDEHPGDVLERRRPNPNFLRIGTTTAGPRRTSAERPPPTSLEKDEEVEEKDTEKDAEAGQQPDIDFKKAKGAKTETQEVPLQAEIEGALEKLEVHRDTETRRQHSTTYHQLTQKAPYAHDGSMGTGYTLIRNAGSAISELDLLEEEVKKSPAAPMHDADMAKEAKSKHSKAKIQKSKAALAKISELLDLEIGALEKKVTTKSTIVGGPRGGGLRAVFQSRGEEAPNFIDHGTLDPRYSKLAGAYVGAGSTTPVPANASEKKDKGADYVEYSDYAEYDEHGKLITMTHKPKTKEAQAKEVKARSTLYDEAVLDTDKATYDEYEEWIGDDKGSKEIINRRTNVKKGAQHDSATSNIPYRPKASRTTLLTGAPLETLPTPPPLPTTASGEKQKKINFDHSDFLKEILSSDYSDYEDVSAKAKLDGDARIAATTSVPRLRSTTPKSTVTPSRSDKLNKVLELENLLGLPHQGLMDETLHPITNPVVWATPSPQFRSEGGAHKRRKILRKKLNKAIGKVDIDNVETNMIDSDIHTFDGDAVVAQRNYVQHKAHKKKKILKNTGKFREQPALVDNDDFSEVKGFSPYPSMRKPVTRGPPKNKAVSFGITGKKHRAIHDGQKGQAIIKSHKMLFRNHDFMIRPYKPLIRTNTTKANVAPMPINDDTVRALDWMMQSLGATEQLEPARRPPSKYQHARVNSNARAEIYAGITRRPHHHARTNNLVDSVAIGSPVATRKPAHIHRPAKILPQRKQIVAHQKKSFAKLHDSDLLLSVDQEGVSRHKATRRPWAPGVSKMHHISTPLPQYPPDLRANPPRQKSITPILESQPIHLLPPPLDEAEDLSRYPRNGAYGTGFELDGSSPDAAAYLAAEATARPAKILPRRQDGNRARGVKTVTGIERKRLIGGAYTSSSGAAAFPSKFVDQKAPPRQPVAGLPEKYLRSGRTSLLDSDSFTATDAVRPNPPSTKDIIEKKPVPFSMHDGSSMDERNTIAAEIERLEQLVNNNKEHFNGPTFSDKGSAIDLSKEFEPLLSDPRLFEDALKEIKEENKVLGLTGDAAAEALLLSERNESEATSSSDKKRSGSDARWSPWGDWGECLCGQQLRTRACETADGTQVSGCKGTSYESQSCNGGSCPKA